MNAPPPSDATSNAAAYRTLFVTSLVGFMVALEITVIALARDEIAQAFPDASAAMLSWVITAYNIGVASVLLPAGWMADRFGRRRMFLWGLAIFAVGSLLSGLASSAELLIVARVVQSLGGALQFPSGLALLLTAFPIERRQMAIGVWGAMGGLAAALGPSVGALLVDALGWGSVFLINVPVALMALLLGPTWLAESRGEGVARRVDLVGVPRASIGVGAFVLAVVQISDWGWTAFGTLASLTVGAVLLGLFIARSHRHPAPLFDLGLFRLRSYLVGNLGTVAFATAFFAWLIVLPEFLQRSWGWSVLKSGFAMAPGPMVSSMLAPIAGRFADRFTSRPLLVAGGLLGVTAAAMHLAWTGTEPSYVTGMLIPGVVVGLCAACGFAPLVGAAMRDVPPPRYAMAGAGRTTIFQLSVAFGVAAAIGIVGRPASPAAFLDGMRWVWLLALVLFATQALLFATAYPRRDGVPVARARTR